MHGLRQVAVLSVCLMLLVVTIVSFAGRAGGQTSRPTGKVAGLPDETIREPRRQVQDSQLFQPRRGAQRRSRNQAPDRSEYDNWELKPDFKDDVFTFVRIEYDSYGGRRGGGWRNDYPDCDWNFSLRLRQLTSMEVHPNGRVLRLTDLDLFDYPFVFMTNVQGMSLSDSECAGLRSYLLNGGFLMADDFWAADAWRHVKAEMQRVLPGREPRELTIDHPIFRTVYQLNTLPQVPSIFAWQRGDLVERWHGSFEGDESPHFQAWFDDNGRMVALFCHNNDIADGWEREGENREYFERYSEKMSYPFGINLITWVMTH